MAGNVFKRCTKCDRIVRGRRCENPECEGGKVVWAFVLDLGKRGDGKRRRALRSGFESKHDAPARQA